jgi:hypothetical protein
VVALGFFECSPLGLGYDALFVVPFEASDVVLLHAWELVGPELEVAGVVLWGANY